MSDMSPGNPSTATDANPRMISLGELESRLTRLEQLEQFEQLEPARAQIGCTSAAPSHDGSPDSGASTVLFSDEPCTECGELHDWSAMPTAPTAMPQNEPSL